MNILSSLRVVTLCIILIALGGGTQLATAADNDGATQAEAASDEKKAADDTKSDDLKAVIARIPDSSPMSKLRAGMTESEVREIMGHEDKKTSYKTGKSWIPKFGRWANDRRRHSLFFNEQGYVVVSQNRYTGQYKLIEVGYEPGVIYD